MRYRHREYTKHLVVRCTPAERARWKALAELEDRRRNRWRSAHRDEGLSLLIRELLEKRVATWPAAELRKTLERHAERAAARAARDVARTDRTSRTNVAAAAGVGTRTRSGSRIDRR